jgi:hypothetical protein
MTDTVYVIGAGASKEVGLPIGDELKRDISRYLEVDEKAFHGIGGDRLVCETLIHALLLPKKFKVSREDYINASMEISRNLPLAYSIDNFIDSRRGDVIIEECAKIGITRAILEKEKDSSMYCYDSYGKNKAEAPIYDIFEKISESWYMPFFKSITKNCTKYDLEERFKQITLIIFNYDRCVEYFLFKNLKMYFNLSDDQTKIALSHMTIVHPYGQTGHIEWQGKGIVNGFGEIPTPEKLYDISREIKTFTEGISPESSEIVTIKSKTFHAKRIVFLGFAYEDLNMKILSPEHPEGLKIEDMKKIYGTAFETSEDNIDAIKSRMHIFNPPSLQQFAIKKIYDTTCSKLFYDLMFALSYQND